MPLLPTLVEGEESTEAEHDDRHQEGVDVSVLTVAEWMFLVGLLLGRLAPDQEKNLISCVGERMDRFRQHGRGLGQQVRPEFEDGYAQVGAERREDRCVSAFVSSISLESASKVRLSLL